MKKDVKQFKEKKFAEFALQERFMPVSRFDLNQALLSSAETKGLTSEQLGEFFHFLHEWRHRKYANYLAFLQEDYHSFNPDRDTVWQGKSSKTSTASKAVRDKFRNKMGEILFQANYRSISKPELTAIMDTQSVHALQVWVELEDFEEIMVYYRGLRKKTEEKRDWRKAYFKKRTDEIFVYDRVFVLLKVKPEEQRVQEMMAHDRISERTARRHVRRLRKTLPSQVGSEKVHMKLFKNMPLSDLAMMFPNLHIQFKLYDKLMLWGTIAAGMIASLIATVPKVLDAAGILPLTLAAGGFGMAIYQQISRFLNLRTKYRAVLSKRLYFHSLADNRAVLTLLANRAAEEDLKEDMLLYFTLLKGEWNRKYLDEFKTEAENFLLEKFEIRMVFDAEEALARLKKDNLVEEDSGGILRAVAPEKGIETIRKLWVHSLEDGNPRKPEVVNFPVSAQS